MDTSLKVEFQCKSCKKLILASQERQSAFIPMFDVPSPRPSQNVFGFSTPTSSFSTSTSFDSSPSSLSYFSGLKNEKVKDEKRIKVSRDAEVYCKDCSELKSKTTDFSRMPAMDFDNSEREVAIVTEDGLELYADIMVLASKSEVFEKMFDTAMKEKKTKQVTISDVKGESVREFLWFLYRGELRETSSKDHAKDLLKLAHCYQVKGLVQMLDTFIYSELVASSCNWDLLKLAFIYDLPKTKEFVDVNATQEMAEGICESFGEECPWYVADFFKTILKSKNVSWKHSSRNRKGGRNPLRFQPLNHEEPSKPYYPTVYSYIS